MYHIQRKLEKQIAMLVIDSGVIDSKAIEEALVQKFKFPKPHVSSAKGVTNTQKKVRGSTHLIKEIEETREMAFF